jgi:hypothetical protein
MADHNMGGSTVFTSTAGIKFLDGTEQITAATSGALSSITNGNAGSKFLPVIANATASPQEVILDFVSGFGGIEASANNGATPGGEVILTSPNGPTGNASVLITDQTNFIQMNASGTIGPLTAGINIRSGVGPTTITTSALADGVQLDSTGTLRTIGAGHIAADSLRLSPIVLSGGTDAINPHISATYMVTTAGVDAMTIAAPTVTTDDGIVIKITTNTAASHTLVGTGGTLRTGSAGVTTATFAAFAGSSIELMAWQGNWYVMAQNLIASYA